jgi:hypothetical protein
MAHFARIDSENKVKEIIVIANETLTDADGVEQESLGQDFIASLGFEGTWLQCSYSGSFRGVYPGIGFTYNADDDVFEAPPVEVEDEAG